MTTPSLETASPTPSESATPRVRTTLRRWLFWIVIGVVVLVASVLLLERGGSAVGGQRLGPDNAAPPGAKAVVEVLRQQGVEVVVVDSTAAALEELASSAVPSQRTTLVIHDPGALLTTEALERLAGAAGTIVLLEPGYLPLETLAPDVAPAGWVEGLADARCADPTAERAGSVIGDDRTYRILDGADSAVGCFPVEGADRYRLVVVEGDSGRVVVLGATSALTNEQAALAGNGALALGLLGEHPRLVWLVPGLAELEGTAAPTIGDLSPEWVVPFALLAILLTIAAAVWRGRRFGPLVVEPLPVVVPASETMQGRARLYAASRSRLRAADTLRIGAIGRLATTCGLPGTASVDEVAAAVAALAGRPLSAVRDLLVDRIPSTDRDLMAISDELAALELEIRRRTRP